jgi:hypothetical protein
LKVIVTIESRKLIPASLYLVVENMGMPFQRTCWYHSLPHARARKVKTGGRLFELSTDAKKEIA